MRREPPFLTSRSCSTACKRASSSSETRCSPSHDTDSIFEDTETTGLAINRWTTIPSRTAQAPDEASNTSGTPWIRPWFDNWPQFSIVNDMYINYLANTAYTRAYSYESAGWARTKGTAALDMQRNVTESQLATNQSNQDIQNQLTDRSRIADLITGAAGAPGTAATGNIGGTIQAGLGLGANMYKSVIGQQAQNQQFRQQPDAGRNGIGRQPSIRAHGHTRRLPERHQRHPGASPASPADPAIHQRTAGRNGLLANGGINWRCQVKTCMPGTVSMIGDHRRGAAPPIYRKCPGVTPALTIFHAGDVRA